MTVQRLGVRLLRRGPPRGLISLGLVGVGPAWEQRYRSAVRRLSHRLAIRAVHDPVFGRAQAVAHENNAEVCAGLNQLLDHPALDGLLILDSNWYGVTPGLLACDRQRPALISSHLAGSPCEWQHLHEVSQQQSVMLVPELAWRFQPSTMRLRELIASRLGPVRSLKIWLPSAPSHDDFRKHQSLALAIDWCGFVSRQNLGRFTRSGERGSYFLEFQPDIRDRSLDAAEIDLGSIAAGDSHATWDFQAEVICERGRGVVTSATQIRWDAVGVAEVAEELHNERAEEDVMLDQFCRRLVGGLIPTATMNDLALAWGLVART